MSQDVPSTKSRNWVRLTGDFLLKTALPIVLGLLVTLSSFSYVSTKLSDSLLKSSMESQGKIAQLENRADRLRETLDKVKAWQDSINPLIADEKLKAGLQDTLGSLKSLAPESRGILDRMNKFHSATIKMGSGTINAYSDAKWETGPPYGGNVFALSGEPVSFSWDERRGEPNIAMAVSAFDTRPSEEQNKRGYLVVGPKQYSIQKVGPDRWTFVPQMITAFEAGAENGIHPTAKKPGITVNYIWFAFDNSGT